MKTFRLFAVFALAAIFSASAFAQTAAQPAAGAFKIGIINTSVFDDDKEGIKKFVAAMNQLEAQVKPDLTNLQTMQTKLQNLQTELQGYEKQLNDPNTPAAVDKNKIRATAQTKYDEFQKLQLEFEYKQKDYKANLERREQTLTNPIKTDIANAIQEFSKQKGYAMILDAARLFSADMVLGLDERYDVTKEFIAFYNARTPATASAATPK
jgi:Skp family chaperone for outer membrane proteins